MARQNFPQHIDRPGLERFTHQRMVGVGEHLAGDFKRLIPAELMLINQQAHQLRNRQHRMGVVKVNRNFVCQVSKGFMQLIMAVENILYRRGDEEIFLTQAQLAPGVGRVVRIQYPGDVFGMVFIFHRREVITLIKFTEVNLAAGLGAPQTERVGRIGIKTRDNLIVGFRQDLFGFNPARLFTFLLNASAEAHFVTRIMPFKFPRVAVLEPVIRRLFLPAVNDVLLKHPVVIADTVTTTRQAQGRQRIEETGGQAPKTAITQPRVILFVNQLFKVQPHLFQRAVHIFVDAQRQQGVRKRTANQKLHRQVINLAYFLRKLSTIRAQPALHHTVADGKQRGVEPLMLIGDSRIFTNDKHQLIGNRVL